MAKAHSCSQSVAPITRDADPLVQLEQSLEPVIERFDGLSATGVKPLGLAAVKELSALYPSAASEKDAPRGEQIAIGCCGNRLSVGPIAEKRELGRFALSSFQQRDRIQRTDEPIGNVRSDSRPCIRLACPVPSRRKKLDIRRPLRSHQFNLKSPSIDGPAQADFSFARSLRQLVASRLDAVTQHGIFYHESSFLHRLRCCLYAERAWYVVRPPCRLSCYSRRSCRRVSRESIIDSRRFGDLHRCQKSPARRAHRKVYPDNHFSGTEHPS